MAKLDKYQQGRMDGLRLAQRIVHEGGAAALDREIEFRGITGIQPQVSAKEFTDATNDLKIFCFEMCTTLAVASIHDIFGAGQKRILRFMDEMQEWLELIADDYAKWPDILEEINNRLGVEIKFTEMGRRGKVEHG